jgi:TRAP-type C4-dicarboxylate transport system permease small subunit
MIFDLKKIPVINISCRVFAALLMIGSSSWSSMNNIHTISKGGCGRNFSTVAVIIVFFCLIIMSIFSFL